jgi:shikimate kinase
MNTLVLIGFRGAGKSTLAQALSPALGKAVTGASIACSIISTDRQIEGRIGKPIAAFVAEYGWEEFRRVEREVIHDVMSSPAQAASSLADRLADQLPALSNSHQLLVLPTIVDCGGGVVEDAATMQLLRQNALVVWVDAAVEDLIARLSTADNAHRPLLNAGDMRSDIVENYARRKPLYARAAQLYVNTSASTSEEICRVICERWLAGKS